MKTSWIVLLALVAGQLFVCQAFAEDGKPTFEQLEKRWLAADQVEVEFEVIVAGPMTGNLKGKLTTKSGNVADLTATGAFRGQQVNLGLKSDGKKVTVTSARGTMESDAPDELNRALLIGLSRMGILHNVFRLTGGGLPDHADGGVMEWVTAKNVQGNDNGISFEIVVSGTDSGTVNLQLDSETKLPKLRKQIVKFPGGEMTVTEKYRRFTVD